MASTNGLLALAKEDPTLAHKRRALPTRCRVKTSSVNPVVANVKKYDFSLSLVKKLKQNPIPTIHRKAPLLLQLSVQSMCIQTDVKWVMSKKPDAFFCLALNLFIKSLPAPAKVRVVINCHNERSDRSTGSLPARLSARASRDHPRTSFSLTAPSARATSEINCFLGNTTTSPSRSISFESLSVKVFIRES